MPEPSDSPGFVAADWRDGLCTVKGCHAPAGVRMDSVVYCLDCCVLILDREQAVAIWPAIREHLPRLTDR